MTQTSTNLTGELATASSGQAPQIKSAPPKAAVRRKIQQRHQRQPMEQLKMGEQETDATASGSLAQPNAPPPIKANTSDNQQLSESGNENVQETELNQRLSNIVAAQQLSLNMADQQKHNEKEQQQQQQQQQRLGLTETSHQQQHTQRRYPKRVFFIIANEFCERFSYYGLRAVLVLYFRSVLDFTDSGSTVSFHLFTTLCYLTPILGAILGDSILGKYKTILYLSIVYFIGELLLVISSVWWDYDWLSVFTTWAALLMIGIGTGGIKPCVSAFGGDQFLAHETKWRENFFSLFYGAINLGSLISTFLTPMLRANYKCAGRSDCYPLAFLVPCVLMLVAVMVFLMAHNYYYVAPLPERNVFLAFCQCTWLALKRKLSGNQLPLSSGDGQLLGSKSSGENTSSSNSSLSTGSTATTTGTAGTETERTPVVAASKQSMVLAMLDKSDKLKLDALRSSAVAKSSGRRNTHWLYLASDQFDTRSIEEFRCVLAILFLFLPTPMFWALFDQQGSLWTLQATRMDGRVPGTSFYLEPDQMMVFNPLLLLASIPLFQIVIYPLLNKCNLLTTPIQRMTTGGLLTAFTFVISALIEFQIQAATPAARVAPNQVNLLLVNGISDCSLIGPSVYALNATNSIDSIQPLGARHVILATRQSAYFVSNATSISAPNESYKFTFKLGHHHQASSRGQRHGDAENAASGQLTLARGNSTSAINVGCPYDTKQTNELSLGWLAERSIHMLYIEQGNGKLSHKLFNESLELPPAGKARVRMLYEMFGSYSQAMRRQYYLNKDSNTDRENLKPRPELRFNVSSRDGQVLLSDYIDVEVPTRGDYFTLKLEDNTTTSGNTSGELHQLDSPKVFLKPGTRSLLVLHQKDAKSFLLRQEVLQDNDYRISVLYQLAPYMLISAAEVLFSITGLEFSYSMAPPNMKSLILGAWCLTTAFGNLLTVAIEAIHFFDNIGYDFLLYAVLMTLDILVFGIIGYNYEPYAPNLPARSLTSPAETTTTSGRDDDENENENDDDGQSSRQKQS